MASGAPFISDGTNLIDSHQLASVHKSHASLRFAPGEAIGKYIIDARLGEGGMGAVYRAVDPETHQAVAIKVIHGATMTRGNGLARFRKEARMLAAVNGPHVTKLLEAGETNGCHFLVMEFIDGCDLKHVLQTRGKLPENVAFHFAAHIAAALAEAHRQEIIHRDIKPENVLIAAGRQWLTNGNDQHLPVAKVTDFGIARSVDQSQSMAMTQVGGLLGTPLYMSPEQCRGVTVLPQSDIYSLGVTLYEMLTGRLPFEASDAMQLIHMHQFDAPPPIARLNVELTARAVAIVERCMAKSPADRYADGEHLLIEIQRLLIGEPQSLQVHPRLPDHRCESIVSQEMVWELDAAPEELWPLVSNTERLNRAIGLPSVTYSNVRGRGHEFQRIAEVRVAGMQLRWQEHPYEWIEARRMSVLREFQGGPYEWFTSCVELEPRASGGTRLQHTVRIAPRHRFGGWLARVQLGAKCRRSLDRVYGQIDDAIVSNLVRTNRVPPDAFGDSSHWDSRQRAKLEERIAKLHGESIDPDLVFMLEDYLTSAAVQDLAHIRPLALAAHLRVNASQWIDLCLAAASAEVLELRWDIICPTCRVAANSCNSIGDIQPHTHCEVCDYSFQSDKNDAIELTFRIHPALMKTDIGRYCIGGPAHTPHVVAQVRLAPGERLELPLKLSIGQYLLRSPQWAGSASIQVQSSGAPNHLLIPIESGPQQNTDLRLRGAPQLIVVHNRCEQEQVLRLERMVKRKDVITATEAIALPRFRETFPRQLLGEGRVIDTQQSTILIATLTGYDRRLETLGDRRSLEMLHDLTEQLRPIIYAHRGDIVKLLETGIMAVFPTSTAAIEAALKMDSLEPNASCGWLKSMARPTLRWPCATIVHCGPALVTSIDGRLEYFGNTVREAMQIAQQIASSETIDDAQIEYGLILLDSVVRDTETRRLLSTLSRSARSMEWTLPGDKPIRGKTY